MTAFQVLAQPPDPQWLRTRVYGGDILVVRGGPPARRLVDHFAAILRSAFESQDPPRAQFTLERDTWMTRVGELRSFCKRDAQARELMAGLFAHFGLEAERTAADVLNLRCQPHEPEPGPDPRHTLGAHRDTWASNVYQQINWWMPVFPIDAERTIRFLPYYWLRPIANDSAEWDLEQVREEVRAARREGRAPRIRNVPEPTATPDLAHTVPVVVEPGDVLLFSGAHLHASVPNASGLSRFSIEMRSADTVDAGRGIGAPNVDGRAPWVAWHWFRRLDSGAPMSDADAPAGRG